MNYNGQVKGRDGEGDREGYTRINPGRRATTYPSLPSNDTPEGASPLKGRVSKDRRRPCDTHGHTQTAQSSRFDVDKTRKKCKE